MSKATIKTQIFINECSLQGQFQAISDFEKSVKQFITLFTLINNQENLHKETYKNEFFVAYEAIQNSPFQESLNKIKDRSLKNAFINIIFNKLNPTNWQNQRLHQETDSYLLTQNAQNVVNTSIAEVAERKLQQNQIAFLLVNFTDSSFKTPHHTLSQCQLIAVIKNNNHLEIIIDTLDNKTAFEQWVIDKLDNRNFLERNSHRFKKTARASGQGTVIYQELETGNYWYFDNFHKTHFEVFNPLNEHLGEADLRGILNTTKQDKTKKINF
jgi:hypothetical protein